MEGLKGRGAMISPSLFAFFLTSLEVFVEMWLRRVWASLSSFYVNPSARGRRGLKRPPANSDWSTTEEEHHVRRAPHKKNTI